MAHKLQTFLKTVFLVLYGIGILILIWYNVSNNNTNNEFFKMNLHNILTVTISIGVAYYLVQLKNDERRKKDNCERMVQKIQIAMSQELIDSFSDKKSSLILQRLISNYIKTVKLYADNFNFSDEIKYIESEFENVKDIIGEKVMIENSDTFDTYEVERIINNIIVKCETVIFKLYK